MNFWHGGRLSIFPSLWPKYLHPEQTYQCTYVSISILPAMFAVQLFTLGSPVSQSTVSHTT